MRVAVQKIKNLQAEDRLVFFLSFTLIGNILISIIKLFLGFYLPSLWFTINAIFAIIISITRFFSIRDYRRLRFEKSYDNKEKICIKNYRLNGILLIFLGFSYLFVSIYMYYKDAHFDFHGYLVYLVALIAFWSLGTSIYGVIKYKMSTNAILSAVKWTNFCNALTSIVLTQIVLLQEFSTMHTSLYNSLFAMLVSVIIIFIGLMMINKTKYDILLNSR